MPEAVPSHTACGHRDCGKSSPYLFLRFLLPALLVSPPILAGEPSPSIPKGNLRQPVPVTSDGRPLSAEGLLQPTADSVSRPIGRLVSGSTFKSWFRKPSNKLPPFALRCGFPVLPSRLLPAFTGRDFITTTDSSATSHRVVRPRVAPCISLIQHPTTQALKQCKASPVTSGSQ
jgi:hypothetical protein